MSNPLVPGPNHVDNWIDRIGSMVFISDEVMEQMNPEYFNAAMNDLYVFRSITEAAIWWM